MRLGRLFWRGGPALLLSTLLATALVVSGLQQRPAAGPVSPATAAASGSTYLCTGYAGCRQAGYSDAGYGAVNNRMYWRMYSGHNCTNYAAYRMIQAGMSAERPWDSSGMAYNWGHAMDHVTDGRPSVGAVAWWDRYDNGTGSSGHVAYVERVVSADEIVISEDSWSGDFHWRRITRDSGRWPTGFIHFVDKAIQNTAPPAVTGTPEVGEELTVTRGSWTPGRQLTFTWQWYADGARIAEATGPTFTPTADQRRKEITVEVTARKPGYTPATATTAPTPPVARGEFTVLTPPTISGEPVVDEVLTATPATWSPPSSDPLYRWKANGVLIEGADGPSITLTRALINKEITVSTHGRAPGYKNSPVRSEPVGPVVVGMIEPNLPSTLTGRMRVGRELTVTPGTTRPVETEVGYQWLRDGVPVSGATAPTYALTAEDLGAVMSVQVTRTRRYWGGLEEVVAGPRAVTARPAVATSTVGRSRKAVVSVDVTVPGTTVPGEVTIKVGRRLVTVPLTDGHARAVLADLAPGDRPVRVWYLGSGSFKPARDRSTVTVRG